MAGVCQEWWHFVLDFEGLLQPCGFRSVHASVAMITSGSASPFCGGEGGHGPKTSSALRCIDLGSWLRVQRMSEMTTLQALDLGIGKSSARWKVI
jgi:hypothetical protein